MDIGKNEVDVVVRLEEQHAIFNGLQHTNDFYFRFHFGEQHF